MPHRCPICGKTAAVEPAQPGGDSCCPSCGGLLWQLRDCVAVSLHVAHERITLESSFADLGADSLDLVELVMALEEEFDVRIPDDVAERIQTVNDAIRYIKRAKRFGSEDDQGG